MRHILLVAVLVVAGAVPVMAKDEWLPITREDLALKDNPAQPGSAAMILYREVHLDHQDLFETSYLRIKIFNELGRKYADVEIPYGDWIGKEVEDIMARTIEPDGSIVEFTGKPFDKMVLKSRGWKVRAKTFSLPDVRPGSIVEYKFRRKYANIYEVLFGIRFEVQHALYTRSAKFTLRRMSRLGIHWISIYLPADQHVVENKDGTISLDARDIAGLEHEDFMPPETTLKARVEFFYQPLGDLAPAPETFWKKLGNDWSRTVEDFISDSRAIAEEAVRVAPSTDPPEARLRKLYTRVQTIRDLTYEQEKTEKEVKREKLKEHKRAEDVLKRNYGDRHQITQLFVALARAAGFEAKILCVSERDRYFFDTRILNAAQLDGEIAVVKLNGKDLALDPATPFCPFGLLPWQRTGVRGLLLESDRGVFVDTSQPLSREALIERKGDLRLNEAGDIEGKVEITFHEQEALQRRLQSRDEDEVGRKKDLEDEIKRWLPSGGVAAVESVQGWTGVDDPLRVTASIKLPAYATTTGRRMMIPRGMFQGSLGQPFRNTKRVHPVYFSYPWSESDDITISLPQGFRVESVPPAAQELGHLQDPNAVFGKYAFASQAKGNTVKLRRQMEINGLLFRVELYPFLKSFFDTMRAGDEQQVVLRAEINGAGK